MRYGVYCTYYAGGGSSVELPDGKTWDDVEYWYIKWDILFYKLKGDKKLYEEVLHIDVAEGIDFKRPVTTEIHKLDEDDCIEFGDVVDEQSG